MRFRLVGLCRQTLAIAVLTLRESVRRQLLPALAILTPLGIVALHASVTGDGTPAGRLRVFLPYSLALTAAIAGAAVLWASCAAVSLDIESRRIQLTLVKPVRQAQLWLGRWLGMLAITAILLVEAGGFLYLLVRMDWSASRRSDERTERALRDEMLLGRRRLSALPPAIDAAMEAEADRAIAEGRVAPDVSRRELMAELRRRHRAALSAVAPGTSRTWTFAGATPPRRAASRAWLRFRVSSSFHDRRSFHGVWTVVGPDGRERIRLPVENLYDGTHVLPVPADQIPADGPWTLVYANADRASSCTLIFPEGGVEMLTAESGFASNLLRGLVVLFGKLGMVAALGLAAGSLFSFPVATFVAVSLLVMGATANHLAKTGDERGAPGPDASAVHRLTDAAGQRMAAGLTRLTQPVAALTPIRDIADGILVPWSACGKATGLMLVFGVLFGLIGRMSLGLREMATR